MFNKGKYDKAIAMYNKAIETCPPEHETDLATFYQNRAAAYEKLQKWSSVIADCSKALDLNEKYEKALYRRARAYEETKDYTNCLDDITAVCLMQSFKKHDPLVMADRVLKELGKLHAAEAMKTRVPKLASKQFIKTYFMSFSEDPVYKKLMDTTTPLGDGELTGFAKAKVAFATEDYENVIPACNEEINASESESENLIEALSLRASFLLISGCHTEALEDLKMIIETKDVDRKIKANALIKRASLYMQMEKPESCLKDFEIAAELAPDTSGKVFLFCDAACICYKTKFNCRCVPS